jgi:hypothetical protein
MIMLSACKWEDLMYCLCLCHESGGSWTEDTDSEDDEQDLTEEEMAEALREAALLTLKSSCKSATEIVTSKLDLSLQSCS